MIYLLYKFNRTTNIILSYFANPILYIALHMSVGSS